MECEQLVVNGHGGNLAVLTQLARELREEGIFVSVFQWWPVAVKLLPEFFRTDERRHAAARDFHEFGLASAPCKYGQGCE